MTKTFKRFFVIGTAKSGTTSIYQYLSQHPEIFLPNVKEIHYYSDATSKVDFDFIKPKKNKTYHTKVIKDKKTYNSLFENATTETYLGDCSPSYFYDKKAARKIFNDYPKAKIIVVLRDPIDRAYSQYLMERRLGIEANDNFLDALKSDFQNTKQRIWGIDHLYVDHGMYYHQLQEYRKFFRDDQILCVSFQDLTKDTEKSLKEISRFLEIDSNFPFELEIVHNKYKTHRNSLTKIILNHKSKLFSVMDYFPKSTIDFIKGIFFKETDKPIMDKNALKYLQKVYDQDIKNLKNDSLISSDFYNYLTRHFENGE
ncbi:sulfotransferase family protein [Formosa algae]|uniref:Sulfotransferase domain-containing protein n=1 Tax=Formosa algae TaxID=225843 RepID=A0A9X0YIX1_9FLAO|nr:sulfotransferase [Formosa algae]MBP1838708.1 hypothetical protein [Formosa algae]MDQ0335208.1 hypothetical protein [Formosa algae]OEI81642.1 hypothetical protein AST99_02885 [Formosa algae]